MGGAWSRPTHTQSELDNIEHSYGDNPARCRRELFKVGSVGSVCVCVRACVYVCVHCFPVAYMYMCLCKPDIHVHVHVYVYMYV